MTSPAIIICGSMAFDTIMSFDGYFKDHILADKIDTLSVSFLVPQMRKEYGGCAGNVAYGLRLLGGNPRIVSSVGVDAHDYLQRLETLGINTQSIRVVANTFTAQCFITTDKSDQSQITAFHPGAMMYAAQNDLRGISAKWAIVAPDAKDAMFVHANHLHAEGIPFIFDLGQAMPLFDGDDLKRMIALAAALTVNEYEAEVVVQRTGWTMAEIAQKMQAVVVTQGEHGATLYEAGHMTHIPAQQAEAVLDPTGCGDAYRSGLLYGLSQGWTWLRACQLAGLMGTIKIASQGPQNYSIDKVNLNQRLNLSYGFEL